ncbi:MAG: type II secretion system F family protein, partial [Pseudohongiella sp.]
MNNITVMLISVLVFVAAVLFLISAYLLITERQMHSASSLKKRIDKVSAKPSGRLDFKPQVSLIREQHSDSRFAFLLRYFDIGRLEAFLKSAGSKLTPHAFIAISLTCGLGGALASTLLLRNLSALSLALGLLLGIAIPYMMIKRKGRKRRDKMVEQLPDAMDYFARALRAGNPFVGAIKAGAEETPAPLADELAVTFDEMNFGIDFDEAMRNFANRTNAEEIRLFVTAVLVQKNTGGNLAELMNRISSLLRERARTRGEIRIQAADMQSSAKVLIGLPFGIAGVMQLLNPDYFTVLLE